MAAAAKVVGFAKKAVACLLAILASLLGACLWFHFASHQLTASEILVREPVSEARYARSVEALTFATSLVQSVQELRLSDQAEPVWSSGQEPLTHLQLAGATNGAETCHALRTILPREGKKQGLGIRFDDESPCEVEVSWMWGKSGVEHRDSHTVRGDQSLFLVLPSPLPDLPILENVPVAGIGAVLKSDLTVNGGHPTCPGANFDLPWAATMHSLAIRAAGHGCTADDEASTPNRPLLCLKYSGSWPLPRVNDQACGLWTLLVTILRGSN